MGGLVAMTSNNYDVMIIGTGPAGLTAALYGVRLGLKVVVFGNIPGGNTNMIKSLDNYPGFPEGISGTQFGIQAFQFLLVGQFLKQQKVDDLLETGFFRQFGHQVPSIDKFSLVADDIADFGAGDGDSPQAGV